MALVAPTHLAGGGLCWPRAECRQISPLLLKGPRPPDVPALSVVNYLRNLPLAERLELVQTLWDSIAAEQRDPELSAADRQQINKRMEAFLADGDPGLDAESFIDTSEQLL